jgi:hypothetical protein
MLSDLGGLASATRVVDQDVMKLSHGVLEDAKGALVGVDDESERVHAPTEEKAVEKGNVVVHSNTSISLCFEEIMTIFDWNIVESKSEHD